MIGPGGYRLLGATRFHVQHKTSPYPNPNHPGALARRRSTEEHSWRAPPAEPNTPAHPTRHTQHASDECWRQTIPAFAARARLDHAEPSVLSVSAQPVTTKFHVRQGRRAAAPHCERVNASKTRAHRPTLRNLRHRLTPRVQPQATEPCRRSAHNAQRRKPRRGNPARHRETNNRRSFDKGLRRLLPTPFRTPRAWSASTLRD
jgi:hypothetical protein